jgi:hypothetical protein
MIMKYKKILTVILAFALLGACTDLDTFPEGSTVTEDQQKEVAKYDPSRLTASVNAIYNNLITFGTISGNSTYHNDFGYPAAAMFTDACGQDVAAPNIGYNWFSGGLDYSDRVYTSAASAFLWRLFYNHIKASNDLIDVLDPETTDPLGKAYLGQGLANRAFGYFNLIQLLQFNYKGNEDKPGVPIVLNTDPAEKADNNPRATVEEVYTLILDDLTTAIALLEGFERSSNGMVDRNVAYGIRARVNLSMQKWADAAADAAKARDGFTPYSRAAVSTPTFNNAADNQSWIWAAIITETNDVVETGIINWPSHLCSMTGNGYTTLTGTYRMINSKLWAQIPASDVRKGWWVDENLLSPLVPAGLGAAYEYTPYTNVKFGAYNSTIGESLNASDWPMMRAEEMYLIEAEGLAMSNREGEAKSLLESFVRTYRNTSYTCSASTAAALQDEIWFQRRIELWGEGFSFFDLLRLKKPVERKDTNFPEDVQFNLPPEAPILLYRIPLEEINANNGISEADNNPSVPAPTL